MTEQTDASDHQPGQSTTKRRPCPWRWYLGYNEVMGSVCSWRLDYMIEKRRGNRWAIRLYKPKGDQGYDTWDVSDPVPAAKLPSIAEDGPFVLPTEVLLSLLRDSGVQELNDLADEIEVGLEETEK